MSSYHSRSNISNYKIGLKLTTRHFMRKDYNRTPLFNLLQKMDAATVWVFLATHGMWMESPIEPEALRIWIDCTTGSRRLSVSHQDYELIHAILLIPIFEMSIEELCSVKIRESSPSPWGIHGKIKRGELLQCRANLELEVTPLTFYAASMGYHRLGHSHRLAALQCALSQKIGETLIGDVSNIQPYTCLYGVEEVQEIVGSLVTYLSFLMRYYDEMNIRAIEAEMTTSIVPRPCDPQQLVDNVRRILKFIVEGSPVSDIGDIEIIKKDNSLLIEFPDSKINTLLQQIQVQLNPLGRLSYLDLLRKRFKEEFHKECVDVILLDFSEQMNPVDVYLLSLLVDQELERSLSFTWVICTPLTYPVAAITSLYADNLDCLGNVNLVLSSEDPYVAKLLAEKLSEELKGGKILYLAAGPTPHVLVFAKTLKDKLGDNVIFESLTP